MPAAVIDASALAAVAFGEREGPAVAGRLARVTLAAPALLWFELTNVCVTKSRRHPADAARLLQALRDALDMTLDVHDVDHLGVTQVATETGLSAYDASYLWLARHLGCELVTLDERLAAAAQ